MSSIAQLPADESLSPIAAQVCPLSPSEVKYVVLTSGALTQQSVPEVGLAGAILQEGLTLCSAIPVSGLQECVKIVQEIMEGVALVKVSF